MLIESKKKIFFDLIESSNLEEIYWMNGYISGILNKKKNIYKKKNYKITIVYGTETGNAKNLAKKMAIKAKLKGFQVKIFDLNQYRIDNLNNEEFFFIIISTHGNGEPPESAKEFFNYISKQKIILKKMKYSVLALGDSSYPLFCKSGKDVDFFLKKNGANQIIPLKKCDTNLFEAKNWFSKIFNFLQKKKKYNNKIFLGKILNKILLNDKGSKKEIYHIEIKSKRLFYEPGDAIVLTPQNDLNIVKKILKKIKINEKKILNYNNININIFDFLIKKVNIFFLSKKIIKKYSKIIKLSIPLKKINLLDLIVNYPIKNKNNFLKFIKHLDGILPRLYSISSSFLVHKNEIHITVARKKFIFEGKLQYGHCSNFLSKLKKGEKISFYIRRNNFFKLPKDEKDIILIGPGTGIAPFRSFLYEREARNAIGKNWLFFGEQHFLTDFLYQTEIQNWVENKFLTKINLAWSRDQKKKKYVQDKIWEEKKEFFNWIKNGAYIYICGKKKPMSYDVEKIIFSIIKYYIKNDPDIYFNNLKKEGRYIKDVY